MVTQSLEPLPFPEHLCWVLELNSASAFVVLKLFLQIRIYTDLQKCLVTRCKEILGQRLLGLFIPYFERLKANFFNLAGPLSCTGASLNIVLCLPCLFRSFATFSLSFFFFLSSFFLCWFTALICLHRILLSIFSVCCQLVQMVGKFKHGWHFIVLKKDPSSTDYNGLVVFGV